VAAFVELSRQGSLRHAAEVLHVTEQGLRNRLLALEERLKVELYHKRRGARRSSPLTDLDSAPEMADPLPDAQEVLARAEAAGELRAAMEELEPLEAKVLYMHFADGLTLPRITELLGLDNRSGAKAYIVSATRKLRRRFGVVKEAARVAE